MRSAWEEAHDIPSIRGLVFSSIFLWTTLSWAIPLSLDQFYIPVSHPGDALVIQDTRTIAQTFTVGVGGVLTAVEIEVGCCHGGPPPDDLLVEIGTTLPDGSPSDDVLATRSVACETSSIDSFAFVRFRLDPDRFLVSPGDMFAIVLSTRRHLI